MIAMLVIAMPAYTQAPNAALQGHVDDLVYHVADLVYRVDDMGGKIESLEVKETSTEVRIDLSADVLFAFDKADLLPEARQSSGAGRRDHPRESERCRSDRRVHRCQRLRRVQPALVGTACRLRRELVQAKWPPHGRFLCCKGIWCQEPRGAEHQARWLGRSRWPPKESPSRDHDYEGLTDGRRRALRRCGGADADSVTVLGE
jgi:hypothetical protein